jgi:16S rRNA (cytidine1402-2'-O)-methyltransferase
VLPGPSAAETALVASGLAADRYLFVGFLPRRAGELSGLWRELATWPSPVVAFESPRRLPAALRSLAAADPEREVAVCRELTKRFEEVVRGSARELAERFAEPPRGEVTLVLGPAAVRAPDEETALAVVGELVDAGVPRGRAAELVARVAGVPRNRLYRGSL